MSDAVSLRGAAERAATTLPPLLATAQRLAAVVMHGEHGRRRAGAGSDFWQYRPVETGDSARWIDWRRSARGDDAFVREHEWKATQSVMIWADMSQAMQFVSQDRLPHKAERAAILGLALAILLLRGGERVGLLQPMLRASQSARQAENMAGRMADALAESRADEYGQADLEPAQAHGRVVLISDFFGNSTHLAKSISSAAGRGVKGLLLQVLDPAEESFPYEARTLFESPSRSLQYETLQAGALRTRYQERLAERQAQLSDMARRAGWGYQLHRTDQAPVSALLWLSQMLQELGEGR